MRPRRQPLMMPMAGADLGAAVAPPPQFAMPPPPEDTSYQDAALLAQQIRQMRDAPDEDEPEPVYGDAPRRRKLPFPIMMDNAQMEAA